MLNIIKRLGLVEKSIKTFSVLINISVISIMWKLIIKTIIFFGVSDVFFNVLIVILGLYVTYLATIEAYMVIKQ